MFLYELKRNTFLSCRRLDPRLVKSATAKPRAEPYTIQNDIFESFPHFKQTPKSFTDINGTSYSGSGASSAKSYQASTAGPKITITATSKCEFQKTALDYRIHVYNGFVQTANGLLAKVTVYRLATGKLWETFVGKYTATNQKTYFSYHFFFF